jgi:hypothetical protein
VDGPQEWEVLMIMGNGNDISKALIPVPNPVLSLRPLSHLKQCPVSELNGWIHRPDAGRYLAQSMVLLVLKIRRGGHFCPF